MARANVQLFWEAKVAYLNSRNSNNRKIHNSHCTSIVDNRCCFVRQLMAYRNLQPVWPVSQFVNRRFVVFLGNFCSFPRQFSVASKMVAPDERKRGTELQPQRWAQASTSGHSCGKFARDRCRDDLEHLEQICRGQCCQSSKHFQGDIQNPKKNYFVV